MIVLGTWPLRAVKTSDHHAKKRGEETLMFGLQSSCHLLRGLCEGLRGWEIRGTRAENQLSSRLVEGLKTKGFYEGLCHDLGPFPLGQGPTWLLAHSWG